MFSSSLLAVTPPLGWLVVTLAAYALVAVPLVLWVLARLHRRTFTWALLPVLAMVVTTAVWFYANSQVNR